MSQRRGYIWTMLGILMAIMTSALIFYLLRQAAPATAAAPPAPTPLPTKPIPVAARELAVGTTITTTDIIVQEQPENLMPVGVMTDTTMMVGEVVVAPIQQGEFFRASQLAVGADKPLSSQIEDQRVAMVFSMEELLNKSHVLREGDHIDLLLTMDIKEESLEYTREGKSTSATLQNIEVMRILRDAPTEQEPNPQPRAILFEMTPQDAIVAKFVKDSGGTVDFTLRSTANTEPFETTAINQDYMFDHYGFQAPISSTKPKQK